MRELTKTLDTLGNSDFGSFSDVLTYFDNLKLMEVFFPLYLSREDIELRYVELDKEKNLFRFTLWVPEGIQYGKPVYRQETYRVLNSYYGEQHMVQGLVREIGPDTKMLEQNIVNETGAAALKLVKGGVA